MWRNQSGDQSFLTPLADAPLPTPTNKECLPQPGKITGGIRGACGMPLSVSVSASLLLVSLPSFSSLPLGVEAMCKQQHLHPEGWLVRDTVGTTCLCLIRQIFTVGTLKREGLWMLLATLSVAWVCENMESWYHFRKQKQNKRKQNAFD